ncbi:type IV pilus biogenesis protein PilM [Pseudalkalibacillus caeni]|uniref:Pilus assembly protein PilM n=1 Tax=Exobacillus caeni TaxID=2574798 RepID=A0A5R9FAL0_9BACL|nr:pilus assembly protein PilM [Pseudalkalibacillus caeni]TLS39236.1 pilus assembly protein PilM [Pseudalkalibacillus caeni]
MGLLTGRNKTTFALTITDHVIRLLEVKQPSLNGVRFFHERYLPEGIVREGKIIEAETLEMILQECVSEWGLKRKKVHFIVPEFLVVLRKESIPKEVADNEIKGHLYMEIGSSIHLPFDDPVFDYEVLYGPDSERKILLFAAPEDVINQYVSILDEVNIKVASADVSALALYRLLYFLDLVERKESTLLIQYNLTSVNLSIFTNHYPEFIRHVLLDTPYSDWKKELKGGVEVLTWSGEMDQLIEEIQDSIVEIQRVLDFYRFSMKQGKTGVSKILLVGDHPKLNLAAEELERKLQIPYSIVQQPELVTTDGVMLPHHFYPVLGLALKGVDQFG